MQLEPGRDVAEQDKRRPAVAVGKRRLEMLEHVESDRQRLARVEIPGVLARPPEGLALGCLQSVDVDAALVEKSSVRVGKIAADHADKPDGRKEARRHGSVGSGTAEKILLVLEGGFDLVDRNAADNQNTHKISFFTRRAAGPQRIGLFHSPRLCASARDIIFCSHLTSA